MQIDQIVISVVTVSGALGVAWLNSGSIKRDLKEIREWMTAERAKRDYVDEMNEVVKNALIHIEEKEICRYAVEATRGYIEISKQALEKDFRCDDADILLTRYYADYERSNHVCASMLGEEFAGLYWAKVQERYQEFTRDVHEVFTDEVNSKHYRFKTVTKMYIQHMLSQLVKQWYLYQSLQGIKIKKQGASCEESYQS